MHSIPTSLRAPDSQAAPMQNIKTPSHAPRYPSWLKRKVPKAGLKAQVEQHLHNGRLHTVCKEAKCPNRNECYARGTATFLIMGDTCSRDCGFCGVTHGAPLALDPSEPQNVATAAKNMGLSYVVITSVTRDDLPDGGARHIADTVRAVREKLPKTRIEILVPDFQGDTKALDTVLESTPDVFNHNVETAPRLYNTIRPQASYETSLGVLKYASESNHVSHVKSGLMVGLGETEEEVTKVLKNMRESGCTIATIGQYLRPSKEQAPVVEYVTPEQFDRYTQIGKDLGLLYVFSAPYVRSSYRADEVFLESNKEESQ